jgi:hypothetical protein
VGTHAIIASVSDSASALATAAVTITVTTEAVTDVVNITENGTVAQGGWIEYGPYDVHESGISAVMTGTGDADLYVRKVSKPTKAQYYCRPFKDGSAESCSLNGGGKYYIAVSGFSANSTYELKIIYTAAETDDKKPTIGIVFPVKDQDFILGNEVEFFGLNNDVEDDTLNVQWSSDLDGVLSTNASATAIDSFKVSNLSLGTHTVTFSTTDSDGNFASASRTFNVVPVSSENYSPVISLNTPDDFTSRTVGSSVSLGAVGTDAEDGNLNNSITWTSSINGVIGAGATLSSMINVDNLSVGTHTITAVVTDSNNATASDSITLIITNLDVHKNMAPLATAASAGSTYSGLSGISPGNIADADASTVWYSQGSSSSDYVLLQWNETALASGFESEQRYDVTSVSIDWSGSFYAQNIDIWMRDKDGNWSVVKSDVNISSSNTINIPVIGNKVQGVVIALKNANIGNYFGIAEVKVNATEVY